jgi:hypothetical protein
MPLSSMIGMIENSGFSVLDFKSLGLDELQSSAVSAKAQVFEQGFSSLVWGFTVVRVGQQSSGSH